MLIDTHCHIDRYPDPMAVAHVCEASPVFTVAVTNCPSHFQMGADHVRGMKYVRLALGLHPLVVVERRAEVELFRRLLPQTEFVGEIGLDFSREGDGTRGEQLAVFRDLLAALSGQRKMITLHSRGAEGEVLSLLAEHGIGPVVFHWYSGDLPTLDAVLSSGHYFSVNPAMIGSARGRTVVTRIPQGRMLTETDGPYTKAERRPAKPSDVSIVVGHLAAVWGTSPLAAEAIVESNWNTLLNVIRVGENQASP